MTAPIMVINPQFQPPEGAWVVNTTSRSTTWSRGLSPFFVGPIALYDGYVAQNMENAWQFAKVYYNHIDDNENPTPEYFEWAKGGWADKKAHRYPAGKGNKALFSYWAGEKLSYVEARKRIYIPLYAAAVRNTAAFRQLQNLHVGLSDSTTLYLWDFDAHNMPPGCDYEKLYSNPNIKFGHAYVLAMLLEGKL